MGPNFTPNDKKLVPVWWICTKGTNRVQCTCSSCTLRRVGVLTFWKVGFSKVQKSKISNSFRLSRKSGVLYPVTRTLPGPETTSRDIARVGRASPSPRDPKTKPEYSVYNDTSCTLPKVGYWNFEKWDFQKSRNPKFEIRSGSHTNDVCCSRTLPRSETISRGVACVGRASPSPSKINAPIE